MQILISIALPIIDIYCYEREFWLDFPWTLEKVIFEGYKSLNSHVSDCLKKGIAEKEAVDTLKQKD